MSGNNIIKHYKPEDIRSPWLSLFLLTNIICGIYIIIKGYSVFSLSKFIFVSILMTAGVYGCSTLIYLNLVHCLYLELTDNEISGKNLFKIKRNSLSFKDIQQVWITKKIYVLYLKDMNNEKLSMAFRKEFIPVLKEILEKSDNLKKIDIDYDYFAKINEFSEITQIKSVLDRRLAELRDKNKNILDPLKQ